ncbi:MAG: ABC transporter ATP-binding protein [Bdellovibrionota bacterium]
MSPILSIENLCKTYSSGLQALQNVNVDMVQGEIFALLGPNGAGKTTLIGSICGLVNYQQGSITVAGFDAKTQYRQAREKIGLVPQELMLDTFATVWHTVNFSRALFGKPKNHDFIEKLLHDFSLWDKKDTRLLELSGGMKRRVMIAKALAHEPEILFLDEPTAGVDVELRKSMWQNVRLLQQQGVTIILTTHYLEEAEEMADRIGVIHHGTLLLVEDKTSLMHKMGKKQIHFMLTSPLNQLPNTLQNYSLQISEDKKQLIYTMGKSTHDQQLHLLLADLQANQIMFDDITTHQSSLEEIFVETVERT